MQRSRPGPQHAGQDQGKIEVHSMLFMVKGHLSRDPRGSEDLKKRSSSYMFGLSLFLLVRLLQFGQLLEDLGIRQRP